MYHQAVSQRLGSVEVVLTSLASLHQAREDVSEVQFAAFAEELLRSYPYIRSVFHLTRVSDEQRAEVESSMQERGYFRFRIQQARDGELIASETRPFYLPVVLVEPLEPLSGQLLGFDPLTHTELSRNINAAIRNGQVRAALPIHIAGATRVLLFKPLYEGRYPPTSPALRQEMFGGAIVAELNIQRLLESVVADAGRTHMSLDFDRHNEGDPAQDADGSSPMADGFSLPTHFRYRPQLDFHGQRPSLDIDREINMESISRLGVSLSVVGAALLSGALIIAWRNLRIRQRQERELQETIREDERRFKLVVETAFDAVFTTDRQGLVLSWNHQAEEMFGWRREERIGTILPRTLFPRESDVSCFFNPVSTGDRPVSSQQIETIARHRDGTEFPIELATSVAGNGNRCQRSAFIRDIRARREQDENLRRAKEAAEAASHAKSKFLATMSHEIRTPINGVMGMIELLLLTNPTDKQRRYAETALRSGRSLLGVINDILDFSKIEADKLELETAPFDLRTVIEDVLLTIEPLADKKQLSLHTEIDDTLPATLVGDAERLRQILVNLAGNAVKFTENGQISLRVSILHRSRKLVLLQFEVSDTGIGLDEDELDEMFNAFTQADSTNGRRHGGTGLGLAIARRLVTLMGGTIGAYSEKGLGSTFHFSAEFGTTAPLPHEIPAARQPLLPERTKSTAPAGHAGEALCILVVEDNPVNREIAQDMLENLGYKVDLANDGREALEAHNARRHDLILMDCHLPDMDGFEITRRIRDDEAASIRIPIIALTADVQRGVQAQCQAAGMDDYLSKPFSQEDLRTMLARWLQTETRRTSSTTRPGAAVD